MPKKHDRLLTQQGLPDYLKDMFRGQTDIRIAVAFWGKGAPKMLGLSKRRTARILCNLTSGACNPKVINDLGIDHDVMSHRRLHGKVYWTPDKAVVGSSNASMNGLVPTGDDFSGWHEANIVVTDQKTLDALEIWFEDLWSEAEDITPELLAEARAKIKARQKQSRTNLVPGTSILAAAMKDPAAFQESEVYLGFYHEPLTPPVEAHRKQKAKKEPRQKHGDKVFRGKDLDYFEDWKVPKDAWIISCDLVNEQKPKVRGATYVPNAPPFWVGKSRVIYGYEQQRITLNGRDFELPDFEREMLKAYMQDLYLSSDDDAVLHITEAAKLLNERRSSRNQLAAFACKGSLEQNIRYRVYYEPVEKGRRLQTCRFIGLYDDWTITHVGEIVGTSTVTYKGGEISRIEHESGMPPAGFRKRIRDTEIAVRHVHNIRRKKHRFYFIKDLQPTELVSSRQTGVRRLYLLDLASILELPPEELEIRSTKELATKLSGREF